MALLLEEEKLKCCLVQLSRSLVFNLDSHESLGFFLGIARIFDEQYQN